MDLHASATKSRVVVLTRAWSSSGSHSVRLVVVGGGSHPRFDFDALVLMR